MQKRRGNSTSRSSVWRPIASISCSITRSCGMTIHIASSTRTLPTSVVITGVDSMETLDQACEAARTFRPLSDPELTALLSKTATAAARGEFEPFKTSSIFDGTAQNPAWLGEEPQRLQDLMP